MHTHGKQPSKKTAAALLLMLSTSFLAGCGNNNAGEPANKQENGDAANTETPASSTVGAEATNSNIQIVLDTHKCVGCGKCARIAPDNFTMDETADKAIVTSQTDSNSSEVRQSAEVCPGDAIKLVKI